VNGELIGGLDIVNEMRQGGQLKDQLGVGDQTHLATHASLTVSHKLHMAVVVVVVVVGRLLLLLRLK